MECRYAECRYVECRGASSLPSLLANRKERERREGRGEGEGKGESGRGKSLVEYLSDFDSVLSRTHSIMKGARECSSISKMEDSNS